MALEKLMEKSGKFDYVLIETTGTCGILSLSVH
jgi:G3E family GTPase